MVVLKIKFLKKAALYVLCAAAGTYALLAGALYFGQDAKVYHPTREYASTPFAEGLPFEEVTFMSEDGVKLVAWWIPAENSKGTVLFCHGNARNIGSDTHVYKMFRTFGYDVLALDYRGFGRSEGKPSEQGTYRDARAAWGWLTVTQGRAPRDIIVWGRSLGAAVATDLAVNAPGTPRALVIEAAFTSLPDIAEELHPGMPVRLFSRYKYDNLKKFPALRCPVLVVHSREDQLINIRHGRRLFAAAPEPKRFLEIKGPHTGLPWQPGYEEGLTEFLESVR